MAAKTARTRRLDRVEVKALEKAERVISESKVKSQQPRFGKNQDDYFVSTMKWAKEAFETVPLYAVDSRLRSKWLSRFWPNEPYLTGIINSVVQIDRNRGWSLVGGRNQVLRFTDILHNWQVQPGRASWRDGVGTMAQAFYTTDIGGLAEVGRLFKEGPLAGLFHLDPTRCVLTPKTEFPLKYYPSRSMPDGRRMVELTPYDFIRVTSDINIDENMNGLGYCAVSRAIELAITMVAVMRHQQEMLFARAPKGLLLLKGLTQQKWDEAMEVREAKLNSKEQEWFGAVAVLASGGIDDIDAKMVALSQLPEGFDQQVFTDLLIYGYSLCFGYDPREFWPVSSGSFGTVAETEQQHAKATGKGGKEFCLGLQEEIQGNLPETMHFEFDERDVAGMLEEANLQKVQVEVVNAMLPLLSGEQARTLLAEQGIIPHEWTMGEEDVEATDTEDADSPENEANDIPEEGVPEEPLPVPEETKTEQRLLETLEVQRAIRAFPDEPIVQYHWDGRIGRIREVSHKLLTAQRAKVFDFSGVMAKLAEAVAKEEPVIVAPPELPKVKAKNDDEPPSWWRIQLESLKSLFVKPSPTKEEELDVIREAMDNMKVIVNIPEQPAPQVTVNVPPAQIEVNVPAQAITIPTPQVTVNIPEQATPQVNVSVPAPEVKVDVHIPKIKSQKQKVIRDKEGLIASTNTEIEYEEKQR